MSDNDEPSAELASVTHLPARRDDGEIVVMTREEWQRAELARVAKARHEGYKADVIAVTRVTKQVVTHPHTVTASRLVARNTWFVVAGAGLLLSKGRRRRAFPDVQLKAAAAAGSADDTKYWFEASEQAKDRRHKRIMDWLKAPLEWLRALVVSGLGAMGMLLALGVIVALYTRDASWVFAPIVAVGSVVVFVVTTVTLLYGALLIAAPAIVVLACWHQGRKADVTPGWLAPANQKRDDEITSQRVVLAFRELGIAPLRKAITEMGDGGAFMLSSVVRAGCGVEVDVTLPPIGVSTLDVINRRRKLAENLGRHEHEVFPTVAPQARTVRVWAADSGALDEPIGPSPLVTDPDHRGDYQRGKAPWGVNLRGDQIEVSLYQRHVLVVGASNQGKSRAMIALALYLALDKRVEFRIADLKGINPKTKRSDWDPMRGIATVFIAGPADEHVIGATEMLEAGVVEMNRRITEGGNWDTLILIVDEAQVSFMCPAKDDAGRPYGGAKSTSRYFTACRYLQNQGRAVDVLLWQGTQNPTDQNLPVIVREGAHLRICTAVGSESQAGMALGPNAMAGGAAPHKLRLGLDKGTLVVAGDGAPLGNGETSVTVRTHYINEADADDLGDRIRALRGSAKVWADAEIVRDLIEDVHEEMRDDEKVRASHMADRLREAYPSYRPYRAMDGERLAALLREKHVEVRKDRGHLMVRAERILRILDERQGVE